MFLVWHTLLIAGMLIVAFGLGYKLGKKKKDVWKY
jgi:LPXTG-motif cell wall-anchored protein